MATDPMATDPMDVALVTCARPSNSDPDAAALARALDEAGLRHATWAWDDPAAPWDRVALAVIRSTWDYHLHHPAFLAWAAATAGVTDLWNPLAAIRWNAHKGYLLDLHAAGVPVVPTALLHRGTARALRDVVAATGWTEVVVKPAVSASSHHAARITDRQLDTGEDHLRSLLARGDALIQPYLPGVAAADAGERAIICIDGEFTHAVRKHPRFHGDAESVSPTAVPISPAERELAAVALAALPFDPFYARIDVVRGADGSPVVMELELIEPSLYFAQSTPALERFAAGIQRRVAARRQAESPPPGFTE